MELSELSLYIIIGILTAIAYSLKRIYLMEVRLIKLDKNIQELLKSIKKRK
jgi:hypothetical protein